MQIGTSCLWSNGVKWSTSGGQEVKDQGHRRSKFKVTDISKSDEPSLLQIGTNGLWAVAWNDQFWGQE